jgi:hypothetical protein
MADERLWDRVAAATGIAFVVLGIIALVVVPQPPQPDASSGEVAAYFTDNRSGILAQTYLFAVAGLFFLWFLGSLRSHLRRAEGGTGRLSAVAFAGGIATFAAFGTGSGISAALAAGIAPQGDFAVANAFFEFGSQVFSGVSFPVIVLSLAASLAILRFRAFPDWLGWLGLGVALSGVIGTFALFADSGFFAPGGGFTYIAFGLFFVWFLLLSVVLIQQLPAPAPARAAPTRTRTTAGRARTTTATGASRTRTTPATRRKR